MVVLSLICLGDETEGGRNDETPLISCHKNIKITESDKLVNISLISALPDLFLVDK